MLQNFHLLIMGSHIKVRYSNLTVWGMMIYQGRDVIDGERIGQNWPGQIFLLFQIQHTKYFATESGELWGLFSFVWPQSEDIDKQDGYQDRIFILLHDWPLSLVLSVYLISLQRVISDQTLQCGTNKSIFEDDHPLIFIGFFLLVSIFCISSVNAAELEILISTFYQKSPKTDCRRKTF